MKFNNNKKQCFAFSCDSTQVHVKRLAVLSSLCLQFAEKEMAPHSSTLAWKIPWTEEPGRLQSMGSLRVGHDWGTSHTLFTFMHWRRKWHPTPVLLPAKSHGQRSLDGCSPWGRRVGHDWTTSFIHWRRKWQPIPVFLPGESQGRGSLVGCRLWGRTESDTLKRLSSSSSLQFDGSIIKATAILGCISGEKARIRVSNVISRSYGSSPSEILYLVSFISNTWTWVKQEFRQKSRIHFPFPKDKQFKSSLLVLLVISVITLVTS